MTHQVEDKKDDFEFKGTYQKKYENIKNLLQSALNQIEKVQNAIETLEQAERKSHYQSIPGTEGVFDGQYLIAQDGRKTEVPINYAAKSKLVYGDILKVFTDSGKQIFKQIDRVERKKIEGVLAKKEGKWYLLSDAGSYRISDIAAEYGKAELNDKASALIPAENTKVPFACLDRIYKNDQQGSVAQTEKKDDAKKESYQPKKVIKPKRDTRTYPSPKVKSSGNVPSVSAPRDSVKIKKEEKKDKKEPVIEEKTNKEYVNNIMDEDDLR